jgi:hypothetical protein
MKTAASNPSRSFRDSSGLASRRRGEEGLAVIVVVALIAILMIYIAFDLRTLRLLGREL